MRFTVAKKMLLTYGFLLLLFAIGTLIAVSVQQRTAAHSKQLASVNMPLALVAADMKLQAIQVQQWLTDVSATHDAGGYEDANAAYAAFNQGLKTFREAFTVSGNTAGLAQLDALQKGIDNLQADGRRMAQTYIEQGLEQGNVLMEVFDASSSTLAESRDPFIEEQNTLANNVAAQIQSDLQQLRFIQLLLLAVTFGAGMIAVFKLASSIKKQLGAEPAELAEAATQIAAGNFNFAETVQNPASTSVYNIILKMRDQLKENFLSLKQRTDQATEQTQAALKAEERATAALQAAEKAKREGVLQTTSALNNILAHLVQTNTTMNEHIESMVSDSHEQFDRIENSSNSMNEMRSTVQDIARSTSSASDVADTAKERALTGVNAVHDVVEQVSIALKQAERLKSDMAELTLQTEGISSVLSVINDIADQTNLLALNAAIEAARAGEAGRGFAVVADEVRKLAEKTVIATKEVSGVIASLKLGTQKNIESVDNNVATISNVSAKSVISGQALDSIVQLVERTAEQVSSIASAAEEQAAATDLLSNSFEDIASITSNSLNIMNTTSETMHTLTHDINKIRSLMSEMEKSVQ